MSSRVPVTFEPAGVTAWVTAGATVLEAARAAGIVLAAPCGGRGVCGSCGVRVTAGVLEPPDDVEIAGIARSRADIRLACRARVSGPVTVRPLVLTPTTVGVGDALGIECPTLVAGVDLGTTSIAAALIDPSTGLELARANVPNPQQTFGADVLSRLSAASDGRAAELRSLAEEGIAAALSAASASAGVSLQGVARLVVAGNTAMAALLVEADTSGLAVHPFTAPAVGTVCDDSALRQLLRRDARVEIVPAIAGFVGGDALAATLSAGMIEAASPMLLVDFGTNAEIVLAGAGSLVVASAAAGPAFEGVGVSCGGPAAPGAVTRIRVGLDGTVELETIGDDAPRWFSGSGLVSAVAELLRCGHIDATGLLLADGPLASRFSTDDSGVLVVRLGAADGARLVLSQLDIRALQLAKAAVRVGIEAVLAARGTSAADLEAVLVAGAFGSAMEPADLIELGVLPLGVADRTRRVGNASLEGAAIVALDPGVLGMAQNAAGTAHHVDLALDAGFGQALLAATEFAEYTL